MFPPAAHTQVTGGSTASASAGPVVSASVRSLLKDSLLVGLAIPPSCRGLGPPWGTSPTCGWFWGVPFVELYCAWPSPGPPHSVVNFLLPGIFQVGFSCRAVLPSILDLPERHLPPCHLPGYAPGRGASCPWGGTNPTRGLSAQLCLPEGSAGCPGRAHRCNLATSGVSGLVSSCCLQGVPVSAQA